MCRSFVNRTVKAALKSVHFDEVTDKNKLAPFYDPRCIFTFAQKPTGIFNLPHGTRKTKGVMKKTKKTRCSEDTIQS